MEKSLTVILPAYNEEGNIKRAVYACAEVLPQLVDIFEIIAVNDGSKDKTGPILDDLVKSQRNLRVYHHAQNKGMGAAVRTGISYAQHELIFVSCSDLQFDIAELKKFLSRIDKADIIIGYKLQNESNMYRRMNTHINHFLLRRLFGLKVKNPNWIKLFKSNVIEAIPITSQGFFWDSEILIKAQSQGYRIEEVPTHVYSRTAGKSSAANPIRVIQTFLEMMKFWFHHNIMKRK